ncbi:MAG: hypothetical protein GWO02_01890 [Gammaproteobacteria bacterium]|nr:hypothetical protein [Gammaproteobacteria bacterium]
MTALLASVTGPAEARLALEGGADIIDLKDPHRGALGALPAATVRRAVAAVGGRAPVSATVGDVPARAAAVAAAIGARAETGVDIVKVALPSTGAPAGCIRALKAAPAAGVRVVVVLCADLGLDLALLPALGDAGAFGIMLDTARKGAGSLRRHVSDEQIGRFVADARHHGLATGLAGSLGPADVPPLLAHGPSYLGFRGALCRGGRREATPDPRRIARLRAAIPRRSGGPEPARSAPLARASTG